MVVERDAGFLRVLLVFLRVDVLLLLDFAEVFFVVRRVGVFANSFTLSFMLINRTKVRISIFYCIRKCKSMLIPVHPNGHK